MTEDFPKAEVFGLSSQARRAATSIPANIAEGHTRHHRKEYIQFLRIAFSSGAELETHLHVAQNVGFIKNNKGIQAVKLLDEVMRMLNKLISTLSVNTS